MDPEKITREELLEGQLLEAEAARVDLEINLLVFKSGLGLRRAELAAKLKAKRSEIAAKYGLTADGEGWDADGNLIRKPKAV